MKLLKLRNLIAAREFNTACANRELANGGWTQDFAHNDACLAEQIAAMLAEPVAAEWGRTRIEEDGKPDKVIISVQPLPGACVRTLPTPDGDRRFLCLPEVDLGKMANEGHYTAYDRLVGWFHRDAPAGVPWVPWVTAAFGPLPEKLT